MSKYLKATAGVAGVVVAALVAATDVLPYQDRPYAAAVVAVATALGSLAITAAAI